VGAIVTFSGFAMTLIGRLEQFAGFISTLFFQTPALKEFFAILDTPSALREAPNAPTLPRVAGEVVFENVSFGYSDAHPALHRLSFRAPPGSSIALVGPTGAGKTTALSLLYRAYDPTEGRIIVDGIDISTVSLNSLRSNIAVVFQDPGLLYRSIADNIRLGNPGATQEQIELTARAAEAHDFIVVKPCNFGGRARTVALRRRAATARDCACDAERCAHSNLGRGHERPRQRHRGAHPKGAEDLDTGPDHVRHCASIDDGSRGGSDPGSQRRQVGGAGTFQRTRSPGRFVRGVEQSGRIRRGR